MARQRADIWRQMWGPGYHCLLLRLVLVPVLTPTCLVYSAPIHKDTLLENACLHKRNFSLIFAQCRVESQHHWTRQLLVQTPPGE